MLFRSASRAVSDQPTGTEHYSRELIRHLIQLAAGEDRDHSFVLYTSRNPLPGLVPAGAKAHLKVMPFPRLWTHLRLSWEMMRNPPDALLVPAHVIPLVHPRASVATIHDLGHLYFPEAYPKATLKYLAWSTKHNVKHAAHLLADSEATKRDIIQHFQVPDDRITVVYPGVSPQFSVDYAAADLTAVRAEYGIDGPYVLYVGTLQPRKNVERLIEAFALAKRTAGFPERLVLAGRMGWLPEGIMRRLKDLGEAVTLAGYVPETDLGALYAGATAFVLPSLFEGFGMPVIEAMASGTPVIAANAASLPEVAGDAALLFDPYSTDELAEALSRLCSDQDLRAELRARGRTRARTFTWELAAKRTLEVLERVSTERGGP